MLGFIRRVGLRSRHSILAFQSPGIAGGRVSQRTLIHIEKSGVGRCFFGLISTIRGILRGIPLASSFFYFSLVLISLGIKIGGHDGKWYYASTGGWK